MNGMKIHTTAGLLLLAAAGTVSAQGCGGEYCIDRWAISSGGAIQSHSGDKQWTLSGSLGQWEATGARAQAGEEWDLTGGFWALTLEELADALFRDRFEVEN